MSVALAVVIMQNRLLLAEFPEPSVGWIQQWILYLLVYGEHVGLEWWTIKKTLLLLRETTQYRNKDASSSAPDENKYFSWCIWSVFAPQGCLPLVLMFDIKEDIEVEPQCITALMEQLDVFISIKPKPKQPSKVRDQACTPTPPTKL